MIDLLIDTNVLIHLLRPTGSAEAGLTRQLLDWDRAGYICIRVPAVSGHEQGRSPDVLTEEMDTLGLSPDRLVDIVDLSDDLFNQMSLILGYHKAADAFDTLMVYTAFDHIHQGYDTSLITGDRNILRHAETLQSFGVPPIVSLRGAVNLHKAHFPLTKSPRFYLGIEEPI